MKLPMPVICECGFSTIDAKKAYDHAIKHLREEAPTLISDAEANELPDILNYENTGIPQ